MTDSRCAQLELFTGLHIRGSSLIAAVSVPKKKVAKAARTVEYDSDADCSDDSSGEDERLQVSDTIKIYPFTRPSKAIQKSLARGWKRRAQIQIQVKGHSPLKIDAHIWMDSSIVGIVNSAYTGEDEGTVLRWVKNRLVEIASFEAQRLHALAYGGVDRVGRGAKEHGIKFNVVPWQRHLIAMAEDVTCHAAWVIAQYEMNREGFESSELYKVIGRFKGVVSEAGAESTTRGCTKKRAFLLGMTRDTIARATERIQAAKSRPVSSRRRSRCFSVDAAPAAKRGRPATHKLIPNYSPKSQYCQACYHNIQLEQKKAGAKMSSKHVLKFKRGSPSSRYCRSGCPACGKRICEVCWAEAECNPKKCI